MNEEENFARLLSQSTTAAAPSWNSPSAEADPWANPFSDSTPTSSNPFASPFGTSSAYVPAPISDPYAAPRAEISVDGVSPYVSKLEERDGPDMPSVIAARERDQAAFEQPFQSPPLSRTFSTSNPPLEAEDDDDDDDDIPFGQRQGFNINPSTGVNNSAAGPPGGQQQRKALPSDLIDEDLLAASDPSLSLKKAFVKSTPTSTTKKDSSKGDEGKPKAYVFTPGKKASTAKGAATIQDTEKQGEKKEEKKEGERGAEKKVDDETPTDSAKAESETMDTAATPTKPASIPLPESTVASPTTTRPASPLPVTTEDPVPTSTALKTPSIDRVAVSPLDPPAQDPDYGFQSLSIGAASTTAPPLPPKSPTKEDEATAWGGSAKTPLSAPTASRFVGKGWGALDDDEEDGGLFGKGGPSVRGINAGDSWGNGAVSATGSEGGWGEPGVSSLGSTAGPSTTEVESEEAAPPQSTNSPLTPSNTSGPPRTPKLLSKPLFQISVGDPTRVGDPVRGYTVYTVKTRTTSPHYRKGEFSVLRRFSDFLWLFETLTMNNPGVIVPPVPDKHPFGRFQDTFIETRRLALQRCLTKITAHPVLQLDPDLRLFLESDHFATESKSRRAEAHDAQQNANKGILSSWTGPKFVEQDDWFESRRSFLDSLESQLKGLSKSIETAGKQRLDMAIAMGDFASSMSALADSDLGSAMCSALARLSDLASREREANEEQAKAEVVHLLNLSDEYVRFISSVRLAFASRIKLYEKWQAAEKEVGRLRSAREKARQQGKLGERGPQTLAEVGEAERRSRDLNNEFEAVSKLVKSEFGRFERDRVEEFKRVLEQYLDGMILRQKELIEAWEEYHGIVLKMVQKNQGSNGSS